MFDVAVLGGGVVGASIAGALAEFKLSTVLLERGSVGAQGASRYSGGIVRLYDTSETIQDLAGYSLERMRDTRVGAAFAAGITRCGVYYALAEPPSPAALSYQRRHGLESYTVEVLSRRAAAQASHLLRDGDDGVVLWEPAGGYGDVRASARMASLDLRRTGALLENAAPLAMEVCDGAVTVSLERGIVRARRVVVATGSWVKHLLPDIPIRVRSIPMVRMWTARPVTCPVIDADVASYIVPAGQNVVQIGARVRAEAEWPEDLDYDEPAIIADACERATRITGDQQFGVPIDVIRGFDAYTNDALPVIGLLRQKQVFVALGFAGIGYKLAVGAAWLLAKEILCSIRSGRLSDHEAQLLAAFSPGRLEQQAVRSKQPCPP